MSDAYIPCSCPEPIERSLTSQSQVPDQYCGRCGRWLPATIAAALDRARKKIAELRFGILEPPKDAK